MSLRSLFFVALAGLGVPALGQEPGPINDSKIMRAACDNDVLAIRALIRENPGCVQEHDPDNRTALHYATAHGALEAMQLLMQEGAPLNVQTNEGLTPIMWALDFNHLDALKLLIRSGVNLELERHDVNHEIWPTGKDLGYDQEGCLLTALRGARPEPYIDALLEGGANVNAVDPCCRWTPMEMAADRYRGTSVLRKLLARGAKVNTRDATGNTPLVVSLQRGDAVQARLLLDSGADPTNVSYENDGWHGNCKQTIMGWAAGNADCVRVVAAFGAPVNPEDGEGHTPRELAIGPHPEVVPVLDDLQRQAAMGWTPVHFAAEFDYPDALKLLKQRGFPIDQPDNAGVTPLMVAAGRGDSDACEALLRLGADIKLHDDSGETCLHKAAASGSVAAVSLLLGYGASPDALNRRGETPQTVAARSGGGEVLKLLANASKTSAFIAKAQGPEPADAKLKKAIESKQEDQAIRILEANPNLASERYAKYWTPLHYAAYYGEARLAEALIGKGSPVEARTDTGWTPLMMAAQQGSTGVVKALLEAKADPNIQAKSGRTALHVAAQENRTACIELLRKFGAKRTIKDSEGLTALQIAVQLGNSDAAKALRP